MRVFVLTEDKELGMRLIMAQKRGDIPHDLLTGSYYLSMSSESEDNMADGLLLFLLPFIPRIYAGVTKRVKLLFELRDIERYIKEVYESSTLSPPGPKQQRDIYKRFDPTSYPPHIWKGFYETFEAWDIILPSIETLQEKLCEYIRKELYMRYPRELARYTRRAVLKEVPGETENMRKLREEVEERNTLLEEAIAKTLEHLFKGQVLAQLSLLRDFSKESGIPLRLFARDTAWRKHKEVGPIVVIE